MATEQKKAYFRRRTTKEIKESLNLDTVKDKFIDNSFDVVEYNNSKNKEEKKCGLVFELDRGTFIPESYKSSKQFRKDGTLLMLPSYKHINELIDDNKTLLDLRKERFNNISSPNIAGYCWRPIGKDDELRKVHLTSCADAHRMFSYVMNHGVIINDGKIINSGKNVDDKKDNIKPSVPVIDIKSYSSIGKLYMNGVFVEATVPSRTKWHRRYEIIGHNIPVAYNPGNIASSMSFDTNHGCKDKDYKRISYKKYKDGSSQHIFECCPHDILLYFASAYFFKHERGTSATIDYSPFPFFSENMMKMHDFFSNNCLVKSNESKATRRLLEGEIEIMLWATVKNKGHDYCCLPTGDITKYDLGRNIW